MRRVFSIILILTAAACAGTTPQTPVPKAAPPQLPLSPASLGRDLFLSQLITGHFDKRTYKMRFEVEITAKRLAVVALSPLGLTLFTLVQEQGKPVIVTQGNQRPAFDPHHMLFDLQLTYWPRKALQPALSSLSMRLADNADRSVRRVLDSTGKLIARIEYGAKNAARRTIVLRHFDVPYRLRIDSREVKSLR